MSKSQPSPEMRLERQEMSDTGPLGLILVSQIALGRDIHRLRGGCLAFQLFGFLGSLASNCLRIFVPVRFKGNLPLLSIYIYIYMYMVPPPSPKGSKTRVPGGGGVLLYIYIFIYTYIYIYIYVPGREPPPSPLRVGVKEGLQV